MATIEVVRDAPNKPLAPVDDTVKIPDSVKRAADKANSYYAKVDETAPAPGKEAVAQPQAPLATITPTPAPAAPASPAAAPPSAGTAPSSSAGDGDWQQRYASMKGRYDKAEATNRSLQEQINSMGSELMRAQAAIQQLQAPAQTPQRLITPEDEQAYGADFIDVVKKAAREDLEPVVVNLQHEVNALRQDRAVTAQQRVYDTLVREIGDWQSVNRNAGFKAWLQLRDPYSGAIRHSLLMDAFKAADAPRVVSIFKGFVTDEAALSPAPQTPVAHAAPSARQPAMSLEGLAAPGRARSAPPTQGAAEKPVYTRADISKFYADDRRGLFVGREADKRAIEADIYRAQHEGRVRG